MIQITHKFSKHWPKRQNAAEKKWRRIRKKVKKEKHFNHHYGWKNFFVISPCGYCKEFDCFECPLNAKKYCYLFNASEKRIFWEFVSEMEKNKPNFRKALGLATKMLVRIREDRPPTNFHPS